MSFHEVEKFYPKSRKAWRKWLEKYHSKKNSVWVIFYKKSAQMPTLSWSDAVEEALCFGWIDSVKRTLDEERSIQFFSKRKAKSTWSKINKEKVQKLIASGHMFPAGLTSIELAKQNGSWEILDSVEELSMPPDLLSALEAETHALEFFTGLSKSIRKAMLQWLVMAKKEETRQKRISEIAVLAGNKMKPKQF
ncbi:MAG: YdeI/OmpD-associated family protein [Bacteroidetes bacterium]|nr:YdeI/OmpD-associated family protein [Bacteroidota bacterium]